MSIASEITRINGNIAAAYTALDGKGATLPAAGSQNSANLADTIDTIATGGGGGEVREGWTVPKSFTDLDTAMTNDAIYNTLKTQQPSSHIASVGIAFKPIYGDSMVWKDNNVIGVYTSEGNHITKTNNVDLTYTWDSDNDAEDGYRWFILYFYGDSFTGISIGGLRSDYQNSSYGFYGIHSDVISTYEDFSYVYNTLSYFVMNAFDSNFNNFPSCHKYAQFESFRTIADGYETFSSSMNSLQESSSQKMLYFPSLENSELFDVRFTNNTQSNNSTYWWEGATAFPTGLDFSAVSSSSSFSVINNYTNSKNTITSFKIKLPPCDVTIYQDSARTHRFDKATWEYLADNAPSVSGKTLKIGSANIAVCGGASGSIITKFTNKGWTVQ